MTTTIYFSDPELKRKADALAKLKGKSFGELVWSLVVPQIEQYEPEIVEFLFNKDRIKDGD